MSASRISILAENIHVDTTGASRSSSSAETAMPLANIATPQPGKRWATTSGDATPYYRIDHGAAVTADTVWIVNFNSAVGDTVTITATDNADYASDPVYQATHDIWLPIYGAGEMAGLYAGGYVPADELDLWLPVRPIVLPSQVTARYWEYSFSTAGVRVGYVMAGVALQLERNFGYPFGLDEVDPSTIAATDGGAVILDDRPRYPLWNIDLPGLSRGEALGAIRSVKRRGKTQPLGVMLFPDAAAARLYQTALYGVAEQWSRVEHYAFDRARISLQLRGLV